MSILAGFANVGIIQVNDAMAISPEMNA